MPSFVPGIERYRSETRIGPLAFSGCGTGTVSEAFGASSTADSELESEIETRERSPLRTGSFDPGNRGTGQGERLPRSC